MVRCGNKRIGMMWEEVGCGEEVDKAWKEDGRKGVGEVEIGRMKIVIGEGAVGGEGERKNAGEEMNMGERIDMMCYSSIMYEPNFCYLCGCCC